MKTLKQILEVYSPKSADEKRFVNKHITVKHADRNGNGDDVFTASNVKTIDRAKEKKGHDAKASEAVYEQQSTGKFAVYLKGGALGERRPTDHPKHGKLISVHDSAEEAKAKASRWNKMLSPGEKQYYKLKHHVKPVTEEVEQIDEAHGKITHYLDKNHIEAHKDWVDSEGFDTKLRALPKNHPLHKTHVGIVDTPGSDYGYNSEHGIPVYKYKAAMKQKAKMKKEEVEQIDEVGDTAKGQKALAKIHHRAANRVVSKQAEKDPAYARKAQQTANRAWERLAIEEIEQLDELSKSTINSYAKKKWQKMVDKGSDNLHIVKDVKNLNRADKRLAKEEVEVNEVLKVSHGAGAWIKDFQDSDNPKFAGKSKEQRKQQALAAFYAARRSGKE